jgi:hypothetical protein
MVNIASTLYFAFNYKIYLICQFWSIFHYFISSSDFGREGTNTAIMQRGQHYRRKQRRSSNSIKNRISSPRHQIYRAATWSGNYELDDDDEEDYNEYLNRTGSVFQQGLSFSGSPTAVNMMYQYAFEEGLELSLIPENEALPFAAGPKVLELGLTGFTGRLIITQQAVRKYAYPSYIPQREEKKDDSVVTSSSSSSSESEGRRPPYSDAKVTGATAYKNGRKQTDRSRSASNAPPSAVAIDDLAAFMVSLDATKTFPSTVLNTSVDGFSHSVEVVSVASSVSTSAAARAEREDSIIQFASIFAAPHPVEKPKDGEGIDEESIDTRGGVHEQGLSGGNWSGDSGGRERPSDLLTEFANTFAILDTVPGPHDEGGSIDDDTSLAAASRSPSAAESSSYGVKPPSPISEFAAAFAALSGPATPPEAEGGSIDDGKSSVESSSASSSIAAAQRSERSVSPEQSPTSGTMERVTEFAIAFASLSGPPNVPEMVLGSIDEGSTVTSMHSASDASHSVSTATEKAATPEKPSRDQGPQDALSEYVAAFGELTGSPEASKPGKGEMIDEESQPSLAGSSSLSSSSASESHRTSKSDIDKEPLDPMTDFVNAFGALAGPTSEQENKGQMIDEETLSTPTASGSLSSSEDPLTQFTKAYRAESGVPPSVKKPRGNIHTPSEKVSSAMKAKRRTSQQSAARKTAAGVGNARPKISLAKKRKIREMFPNYPDVSTGSHGSLDPVGVYLHQKCSAPFEKTLGPKDLAELLEVFPFAAYCADDKGRLPLHVLGENGQLVNDPQGRQRATALARLLIQAYPQSVTYSDSDGRLPFVALLQRWIDVHYDQEMSKLAKGSKHSVGGLQRRTVGSVKLSGLGLEEKSIDYDKLFPNMALWPPVEWCLGMLSMVLDDMTGKGMLQEAIANRPLKEQIEARRQYVWNIFASVPYLLKAVLFLDGGVGLGRKRVLQMSFIRRGLLSSNSVGKWLEAMFLKQGTPSKLAIDYFHVLSQTTPEDYVGPKRTPDEEDVDAFHSEREEVFQAIANMEVIIPALVVLEEKETERAATTDVV